MSKKIEGIARKIELGTGFWGIETKNGEQYQVINMPEQLKYEGKKVFVRAEESDELTAFMWGTPIKIISFRTVSP